MTSAKNINLLAAFAALFCAALWGSNFVTVKLALSQLPPLLVSAIRLGLTALVLIWFVEVPKLRTLFQLFLVSITMYVMNFGLINIGIKHVDAGLASIIIEFETPIVTILSFIFFRERLNKIQMAGFVTAFLGIILASYTPHMAGNFISILLLLGGAIGYSISMIQIKQLQQVKATTLIVYSSLFACVQLLILSVFLEEGQWHALMQINSTALFGLMSYTILGQVAFFIWTRLIQKYYVNQIMPFILLTSVFAILFGIVFLDETLTTSIALGAVITSIGVAFVTIRAQDFSNFLAKIKLMSLSKEQVTDEI